jgi:hypothetical protein
MNASCQGHNVKGSGLIIYSCYLKSILLCHIYNVVDVEKGGSQFPLIGHLILSGMSPFANGMSLPSLFVID